MARGLRQYAMGRNKKRLEKLQQNEEFESVVEYLFVEGFADTIENAEVMAENISETWVNEIMEAYVDLDTKKGEMRRRANRTLFVKGDWERANKIDTARETHNPAEVQAKAAANRKKGSVTEENYETKVQPPREPLKTDRNMFSISQEEKDAARKRTLEKAKAMRAKKGLK
jgi:hypothetical protein